MKTEELKVVIEQYLADSEIELVNINVISADVFEVEIDSLKGVTIDECGSLSRFVDSSFDRDKDDFELTIASYSVSSPFKTILQYKKNIGRDVEVALNDGVKIIAILTAVNEEGFTLEYDEKVEVEGKKRKVLQHFVREVSFSETKKTKLLFK